MEIGLGLDGSLKLSIDEESEISIEAARLGYTSIWTPEHPGYDAFQICTSRWIASKAVVETGLETGISVSPVALRTPISLAMSAGTMSAVTRGRFTLGIGSGSIHASGGRLVYGTPPGSTLNVMKEYLTALRGLLSGKQVTLDGDAFQLYKASLAISPPPSTPVYLGALGPRMLRLGGKFADGIALNWCTSEQLDWSRHEVAIGAKQEGRDPKSVKLTEYIRICVDDDLELAKRALAKAALGYALGPARATARDRSLGYRAHFERMGFTDTLLELDSMRDLGSSLDDLADRIPDDELRRIGYFGPASGAKVEFLRLAQGLDRAIVRVVPARPGFRSVLETVQACAPISG